MRIVIIGSGGRLGAALARAWRDRHAVVVFDRKGLDLSRPEIIADRLEPLAFDAIVLTGAITGLEACQENPDAARAANVLGPAQIADLCARRGARLIYTSTDYVYDGSRPGLRAETDPTGPLGVYAATKLEGEQRVLAASEAHLALRVSWIFGPDRPGFPDSIISRAQKNRTVDAISDKWSIPTYSHDLAGWIEPLLADHPVGGVMNLASSGSATWYEYAQASLDIARSLGVRLACEKITPSALAAAPFSVPRPIHTAMSSEKYTRLTGLAPRPWRDALADYLARCYSH